MRIIAGALRGRLFNAPKGRRTHPMSEKGRGGLFNSLGDVTNLTVLDAFAGSGALSFEAISRGAARALAIEVDRRAYHVLTSNITQLGLEHTVKAVHANASGWSNNNPNEQFDIVLAAPPYDNSQLALVQKLTRHTRKHGVYVLDWPGKLTPPELTDMQPVHSNNYGDAQLVFYRPL